MKAIISALVASTALTAATGWSASARIGSVTDADARPLMARSESAAPPVILADNDEDEHRFRHRHDDDDDDEHRSRHRHDDDEEEDDCYVDDCSGSARPPAPAGTVAPPSNRLFENGATPRVQIN